MHASLSGITVPADTTAIAANLVVGGSTLNAGAAGGDIKMTGDMNVVVDTTLTQLYGAMSGSSINLGALLSQGDQTTSLNAAHGIELGAKMNLVYGGNEVSITAGNAVKMTGAVNVVAGETVVEAFDIDLTPEQMTYITADELAAILPAEYVQLATDTGMAAKLAKGVNANVVLGGTTMTAGNDITTSGTISALLNTPATDLVDALLAMQDGGSEFALAAEVLGKGMATSLSAGNNIELGSRLNLLHGGNFDEAGQSLALSAGNAVNMNGTFNVVSGNVTVNATDINLTGQQNISLNVVPVLTGRLDQQVIDMVVNSGITGKIQETGINANVVTGGATLTATNNIKMDGMMNAVFDTELTDVIGAVTGDTSSYWEGGNRLTSLNANNNIELLGRLNVVNGGYVQLNAGLGENTEGAVKMAGTFNVISGGAQVKGNSISIVGQDNLGLTWDAILPESIGTLAEETTLTEKLNKGINASVVAGGAQLEAVTGDISMGGMIGVMANTTVGDVFDALTTMGSGTNVSELGLISGLLQDSGAATSVKAYNNIELGSRLNLLHGGNFNEAGQSLALSAGNAVNMNGTFNVVSGNVTVNATDINLTGQQNISLNLSPIITDVLGEDFAYVANSSGIINKVATTGINANVVTGGATLTATNNIKLDGMMNAVLDTELSDVVDTVKTGSTEPIEQGGNRLTSLNAGNNIDLQGRLNVVNGGYVQLNAGLGENTEGAVNISGTFNVVSGGAQVNGNSITMAGKDSIGLEWEPILYALLPDSYAELAIGAGVADKLDKGVNANVVAAGAQLTAKDDITLTGMASAVVDTSLGNLMEAASTKSLTPLLSGGDSTTTLDAGGDISLESRLNVLHGGNGGVVLTAGETARMQGTANVVSGNVLVDAKNIEIAGQDNIGLKWDNILPDKYAEYGDLAEQMGIIDKLNSGVNGSVIAGGATLDAEQDITITGMVSAVVDTTADNVVEALQTLSAASLVSGGTTPTTLTAGGDINLHSRMNVVNGGQVALDATGAVDMSGTFNVVSGNATVKGNNIKMDSNTNVGIDLAPVLSGHYAEVAEELGMTEILGEGVSSNVVAGGAELNATNDIELSGVASAIVDTSLDNVISAVKQDELGPLMNGGADTTTVTAGRDIKLSAQLNVVNGGNTENAGGVRLSAGNDVTVGGELSVVNRASVTAGQNVNIESGKSVLKYSEITAEKGNVNFTGTKAELTDVSISGQEVVVANSVLTNTEGSEIVLDAAISIDGDSCIENYGSMSLNDVLVANGTLFSDSNLTVVTGELTLQSATLVYTTDTLTDNTTGIKLSATGDALAVSAMALFSAADSSDAVAGVNFVISSELLAYSAQKFELILFEGATQADFDAMEDAIQDSEVSITMQDLGRNAELSNVDIIYEGGNIIVTGTAAIPEPTTATLSLLALAALAARRRR